MADCKKPSERESALEPGIHGGLSSYRVLALCHIAQHFVLPYDNDFLPAHTDIEWIDSSNTDGDGYLFKVNLGKNGVVFRDGIKRKGSFTVELSDTAKNYSHNVFWQAAGSDSFATWVGNHWETGSGFLELNGKNADSAILKFNFKIISNSTEIVVKTETPCNLQYYLNGNFNQFQTGMKLTGTFRLIYATQMLWCNSIDLNKKPGCFSNWNTGTAEIFTNAEFTDKNPWKINANPFGNESCDMVYKISLKQKQNLLEETRDAW